jgi:predicted aconitase with swiveling domain
LLDGADGPGAALAMRLVVRAAEATGARRHPARRAPDLILAIGAAVAEELYGVRIPVVALAPSGLRRISDGARLSVDGDGSVRIG